MLHEQQYQFIEYLANPRSLRGKTQKEFAQEIQVVPQTLCEWKKDHEFQIELIRRIREQTTYKAPDIIMALEKKALSGDVRAIRLWLEFAFSWSSKNINTQVNLESTKYVICRG